MFRPYDGLSEYKEELLQALDSDIARFSAMPDFSYRKSLAHAALAELFEEAAGGSTNKEDLNDEPPLESLQLFTQWSREESDACGRPLATQSSDRCTTGEATFVCDLKVKGLAHAAFVLSTQPHAKIAEIDTTRALEQEGVLGFISIDDIPKGGTNNPGKLPINIYGPDDTPIFSGDEVNAVGQIIGMIVATDIIIARRAAKLVNVKYHLELPAIITMEDAIQEKSYLADPWIFGAEEDTVQEELAKSNIVVEGQAQIGAQEHVYMETQSCVAIPGEDDEWVIHTSSQAPAAVQLHVSAALGIPAHKVIVKVKRVGGAFGGKASQSIPAAVCAAVAANVLKRPVSVVMSRHEDMLITGKRHPAMIKYKVGVDPRGLLKSAHLQFYLDGGYSLDMSNMVTWLAAASSDACFYIPVMRSEGYTLKTNKNSNTAFRGFGIPQAYFAMNCILEHVAHAVEKPLEEIQEMNFNRVGGTALLGYEIINDNLLDCWKECLKLSAFQEKRDEVDEFNKKSTNIKRGIALGTTRYALTHAGSAEQASALVQIYLDGTVAVSIGGVEMGQGLNTKCLQVASRALGLPLDMITIIDSGTDKTANAPETGGSQNADTHGKAVKVCCEKLLEVLEPVLKEEPDWRKAIIKAYAMKLKLQVSEHITIERKKYGIPEDSPTYQTSGAACVMSEVDCRTGEQKLLSVDVVLDVGRSLNPAIDIGQIEGAFMQGYGLMTSEEFAYDDNGKPIQDSMYKYKIPTAATVPRRFRVKLLKDSDTFAEQVYSSKGIGEPPLMLSVTALASLRYAINARRRDLGFSDFVELSAPLTTAKIISFCNP
ncbi:unnamed protein product [Cylicocyclus nassatus]|uniref:Aldehyde oxidase/xanthine dehydrogenase a/b hammerhead domain-containing protein n=1 Tax=Cylicocyclus nassatus TaxID=53992 RepID=A0AA36MGX7_CYLNA|nr:unnamed protein product [Cylicocyclus nassatus]